MTSVVTRPFRSAEANGDVLTEANQVSAWPGSGLASL
jgi:hypothetical protein